MKTLNIRKSTRRAKSAGSKTILAAAAFAAMGLGQAKAAQLFWDADGAGANTGGTGNWSDPNVWHNGSATGALQNWADGNDAVTVQTSPTAAATITLTQNVSANSLSFSHTSNTYTLAGTSTFTI